MGQQGNGVGQEMLDHKALLEKTELQVHLESEVRLVKVALKDHPVSQELLVHLGQVGKLEQLARVVLLVPRVFQAMLAGQEKQERKGRSVLTDLKGKREFPAPPECLVFRAKGVYLVYL